MKLVIHTQHLENYNHSGEGEPRWKYKGGETYVMPVDESQAYQIGEAGINWMAHCFEENNEGWKEYVTSTAIVADDTVVKDYYSAPWMFEIDHANQQMIFSQRQDRDEYCRWEDDIVTRVRTYAKDLKTGKEIEGSWTESWIREVA
jgi:hypothetical protein